MTTIALTGAAGNLGRLVAEQLLDRTDPADVVLITRRPEAVADLVARGASVRTADFDDPATLAPAFAGVHRLLIISADTVGQRLEGQLAAVAAAKDAGVGHVFYTSVTEPTVANPAGVVPDHLATEGALAAALLLPEPAQTYDITGPAGVSTQDLAALAATLGDKPVEVVDVTDEEFVAGLVGAGLPEPVAQLFASFGTATRLGFMAQTGTAVADLTGRQPTPLAALVR